MNDRIERKAKELKQSVEWLPEIGSYRLNELAKAVILGELWARIDEVKKPTIYSVRIKQLTSELNELENL